MQRPFSPQSLLGVHGSQIKFVALCHTYTHSLSLSLTGVKKRAEYVLRADSADES